MTDPHSLESVRAQLAETPLTGKQRRARTIAEERLEALNLADVRVAKVGHIVATLKKSGRQHALVVEVGDGGRHKVRGVFSATQIARQLGVAIQPSQVAFTFSEIEATLAR